MGRKRKTQDEAEQGALMEVGPENAPAIKKLARAHKEAQAERCSWLAEEKDRKEKLLAVVREANLTPDGDGVIKFRVDGMTISVTPRDELVRVKEDGEEE